MKQYWKILRKFLDCIIHEHWDANKLLTNKRLIDKIIGSSVIKGEFWILIQQYNNSVGTC